MNTDSPKQVVAQFWAAMQTNDWRAAAQWLSDDYVCEWAQSGERIRGRENFIAIQANYPAHGKWRFTINQLIAEDDQVVSDVSITDGVQHARAITFSTVRDGKITRQIEYWPDPMPAAEWRSTWVERM